MLTQAHLNTSHVHVHRKRRGGKQKEIVTFDGWTQQRPRVHSNNYLFSRFRQWTVYYHSTLYNPEVVTGCEVLLRGRCRGAGEAGRPSEKHGAPFVHIPF